jgi:hypothetical protein
MYSEQHIGDVLVVVGVHRRFACSLTRRVAALLLRCPSNVPNEYRTLERNLSAWYSPWTRNHGSMRILDPAFIPDSLVHQRAVVSDFWRGVSSWGGEDDNADRVNPYDFAIEFR